MLNSRTYVAIPPGATIKELLVDRGMSQRDFAARMNLSEKHVSRLVNGEVQLTPEVANKLEMVLGAPASFWSNLESNYRNAIIKVNDENTMDNDLLLSKQFPYREMAGYDWVPTVKSKTEEVICLRKFFEISELSLLDKVDVVNLACRRLKFTEKGDLALLAWAQKAKIDSREINTDEIDIKKLKKQIPFIRNMTLEPPEVFCPQLKKILSECGIALIFLPALKGSFLHGATFYYNGKIVVSMTDRGKDADRFWFSLFHELGHIVLGHINKPLKLTSEDEKAADSWAANVLIDNESYDDFINHTDIFTKNAICNFAQSIKIDPGIVVGRLQKDNKIKYSQLNDLKKKYSIVA